MKLALALSVRDEILRNIPVRWKENFGGDFYDQYQKMRLRFLKARVATQGTDHKIEYMITQQNRPEKLVFLPGFADNKENFYNAAQFLNADFDLLVPDLPGFGRSFRNPDAFYKLDHYARWMSDFLEQIGWTDFHLVGNSLGGAVAVQLALNMPERIKSLTLVDCAGIVLRDQPSIYHEFLAGRNIFEVKTPLQFQYLLNRVYFTPPMIPPFVWDHIFKEFNAHAQWHKKVLSDLLEGVETLDDPRLDEFTLNKRLKDIKVPTMVVWGDEDTFFPPATADFVHSQIPGSLLYLLADRGHGPQVEAPRQFAQLLKKFVKRQTGC